MGILLKERQITVLVLVLVVVLPMAPLEPLRKFLFLVVLSTNIFHITIFSSPSGVRDHSGCIVFVAILETVHCFHILQMGR
jgi:hypothetical protein